MRARLVEDINFERGKDPKKAMDIGSVRVMIPEISADYDNLIEDLQSKRGIKYQSYFGEAVNDIISQNNLKKSYGWGNIHMALDKLPDNDIRRIRDLVRRYRKLIDGGIKESVNFERGKDPKEVMGIGKSYYDKETATIKDMKISATRKNPLLKKYEIDQVMADLPKYLNLGNDGIFFSFSEDTNKSGGYFSLTYIKNNYDSMRIRYLKWKDKYYDIQTGKQLFESLDFERGKDPREVIGLGMEQQIDNFLKSVDQSTSNLDHKLKICSRYGKVSFVEYLIKMGADPRAQGDIALTMAINRNDSDMAKALIKAGSKIDSRYISKHRRKKRSPEIRRLLSKYGMDLDESVNFERGKDPKDALSIGSYNNLDDKFSELMVSKLTGDNPDDKKWSFYNAVKINLQEANFGNPGLIKEFKRRFILGDDPNKICLDALQKSEDFPRKDEMIQTLIKYNKKPFWKRFVKESIDFERGQDPKRAMRIGIPKDFDTPEEAADWLVRNLELITQGKYSIKDTNTLFSNNFFDIPLSHDIFKYIDEWLEKVEIGGITDIKRSLVTYSSFLSAFRELLIFYKRKLKESISFERGKDPYQAINIGKHRFIKNGEPIEILYKGKKMQAIALDDEEFERGRRFIDFMDQEGDMSWAVRNEKGQWIVPSENLPDSTNESISFERGKDPKDSLGIGMKVFHADGLGLHTKNTGFAFDEKYAKDILKNMGYSSKYDAVLVTKLWPDGGNYSFSVKYLVQGPGEYDYVKYLGEYYPIPNPKNRLSSIKESLDFERGKDPKDVLDIGLKTIVEENIKNMLLYDVEDRNVILEVEFPEGDYMEIVCDDIDDIESETEYLLGLLEKFGFSNIIDEEDDSEYQESGGVVYFYFKIKEIASSLGLSCHSYLVNQSTGKPEFYKRSTCGAIDRLNKMKEKILKSRQ